MSVTQAVATSERTLWDITVKKSNEMLKTTNDCHSTSSQQWSRVREVLFSESVWAKVWFVASKAMGSASPPVLYPEYTGQNEATYVYRTRDFWTSGFFPGSLYLLLERSVRYEKHTRTGSSNRSGSLLRPHQLQHEHLCRWWTASLHANALKQDTHDLGFMIAPWAMKAWDLYRDPAAYNSLILAAHSLASRYSEKTQCLRSWDVCITQRYMFTEPAQDFLVIIDNMLNLDLLFWVARETENTRLYEIARSHAMITQKHHIRADNSTFHVVNLEPETGAVKSKFTNQGYSDGSCWARGQAWGVLGFMQTFEWTHETAFLNTARNLADRFLNGLPADGVPYWDFDAPITESSPRDTSAAMICACGLLMLYKALLRDCDQAAHHYLNAAIALVDCTVIGYLNPPMHFEKTAAAAVPVYPIDSNLASDPKNGFEDLKVVEEAPQTILTGATINNYEFAPRRWANHGLVYADYYFVLFGNMLLGLGLAETTGTHDKSEI